MVVGGAPERVDDHALRVAHQGLDMIFKATEVKSPATGKSLQASSQWDHCFDMCPKRWNTESYLRKST